MQGFKDESSTLQQNGESTCEANQLSMRFQSCAEAYSQEELLTAPVMQARDEQRAAGYADARA
jgi:uncharacterized protein YdeI (YjbR/CyaY-like superfamily)